MPLKQDFASPSDTISRIGMNGKSNVFKVLKDAGIPEQWRKSYPIFKCGEEIVWIPGISVSKIHSTITRQQGIAGTSFRRPGGNLLFAVNAWFRYFRIRRNVPGEAWNYPTVF